MKKNIIKKYRLFFMVLLIDIIFLFIKPETSKLSMVNSYHFFGEVLKILPPVMILMGLLDIWVSREAIEAHLGEESGMKGSVLSIFLGTAAAGPLFAAFPIAVSLKKKGGRTSNIVIFLGAWATIKIPMLIIESSFIGLHFALWRLVITIPFIICIGYIMERFVVLDIKEDN